MGNTDVAHTGVLDRALRPQETGWSQVMPMIKELETVALDRDLAEYALAKDDLGTVVHAYEDGKAFEVEYVTLAGETIAVVTLGSSNIRPCR